MNKINPYLIGHYGLINYIVRIFLALILHISVIGVFVIFSLLMLEIIYTVMDNNFLLCAVYCALFAFFYFISKYSTEFIDILTNKLDDIEYQCVSFIQSFFV
jgi:type IV secretory pathway VirB3-like protein